MLIEDDSGISNLSPRPDCPTERGEEGKGGGLEWEGEEGTLGFIQPVGERMMLAPHEIQRDGDF